MIHTHTQLRFEKHLDLKLSFGKQLTSPSFLNSNMEIRKLPHGGVTQSGEK